MKSIFKFLFNVLRNTSLVIIIVFVSVIFYIGRNEASAKRFIDSIDKKDVTTTYKNNDNNDDFGTQTFEEVPQTDYGSRKFKIKTTEGYLYLRPSQIMYVKSNKTDRNVEIITDNNKSYQSPSPLYKIYQYFLSSNETCFLKTKTAIINCNKVQEIKRNDYSYNYQNLAIMENGDKIQLSKPKAEELEKRMSKCLAIR